MSLDPAAAQWPAVVKTLAVLAWVAAVGIPLAWAALGERGKHAWLLFAPATGTAAVLVATNLASWAAPGGAGAWLGLTLATLAAAAIGYRTGVVRSLRDVPVSGLALTCAGSALLFAFLLANRTQILYTDEGWHLPLAALLADGHFPPVSPYAPDVGPGYHYGADLLGASLMNAGGAAAWTAFYLLTSALVTGLALAVAGFVLVCGGSRVLAAGAAVAVVLLNGRVIAGLPEVHGADAPTSIAEFLRALGIASTAHPSRQLGSWLLNWPQFALGLALILLVAASLRGPFTKARAALAAVAAGLLPLADSSLALIAWAGLAPFVAWRLWRSRGEERGYLGLAVAVAVVLAALSGGAVTDALFGRGGAVGLTQLRPILRVGLLDPFTPVAAWAVGVGTVTLAAVALAAAARFRDAALAGLALIAVAGLAAAQLIEASVPVNTDRLLGQSGLVAVVAAFAAAARWIRTWPAGARWWGAALVTLAVVAPTALPRAISGTAAASAGVDLGYPSVHDRVDRFENPTLFAGELRNAWPVYEWMRTALPSDSRVLTPEAPLVAAATRRAAPTSAAPLAAFDVLATPIYEDALRFLARADLAALGITHMHTTDATEAAMSPEARARLADADMFELLASFRAADGTEHRVFRVARGAGAPARHPSSLGALAARGAAAGEVRMSPASTLEQRRLVLLAFHDAPRVTGPVTHLTRASAHPAYAPPDPSAPDVLAVLPAWAEPTPLGLTSDDAAWRGYGLAAYASLDAWSATARPGREPASLGEIVACAPETSEPLELRVTGEPGEALHVGEAVAPLTGSPAVVRVAGLTCDTPIAWTGPGQVPPFVQVRASASAVQEPPADERPSLAFDGGVVDGQAVVNLWYRNAAQRVSALGTELRLYPADASGMAPRDVDPRESAAWWQGPLVLSADLQLARLEFDPRALTINGDTGTGMDGVLRDGSYLLALTLAGLPTGSGDLVVSRAVPLLKLNVQAGDYTVEVLAGILALDAPSVGPA